MKRYFILILMIFAGFSSLLAQKNNEPDTVVPIEFERQYFIYQLANKYNDPAMAKSALYNMLSIMPGNMAVMDSLALLFYETQQYVSAALISQDVSKLNPGDELAVEIAAISFDNLGIKEKAIGFYEKMYLNNNDVGVLYRVAFLQYELKRFIEAAASVKILMENNDTKNELIYFPKNDQENQEISLLAASYRLLGMIEKGQGNKDKAKENFNKALELAPDFIVVKEQLKQLN